MYFRVDLRRTYLVALATVSLVGMAQAETVSVVAPGVYNANTAAMDAALGITGYTIEDFGDAALVAGLTIEHTNPNAGPVAVLPNIYTDGSGVFFNNSWDNLGALVNTTNNVIWFPPVAGLVNIAESVTFHFAGGITQFGVGLGNFQDLIVDHAIFVDGVLVTPKLEDLAGFVGGVNVRNGYLRISADPGDSFNSVSIQLRLNGTSTPTSGAAGDGLIFDHLAFDDTPIVPEPTTVLLTSLALGAGWWRRRKSRAA